MVFTRRHNMICRLSVRAFLLAVTLTSAFPQRASAEPAKPLTGEEITHFLDQWGAGIVEIGALYQANKDYKSAAKKMIDRLYGYAEGKVLFKPTKAAEDQFRETKDQALSYFIGGGLAEDHGFALQPWSKVRFEHHAITVDSDSAAAMGNYFFTDAKTGRDVKVEYTFGITRAKDGRPVIFLHHSSLPYVAPKAH